MCSNIFTTSNYNLFQILVFVLQAGCLSPKTKIRDATLVLLCRKTATHDSEIRHLYEEMEAQIKTEKDRLLVKVGKKASAQTFIMF